MEEQKTTNEASQVANQTDLNSEKMNDQQLNRLKHLQALKDLNLDPFLITKVNRTCTLQEFRKKYENYTHEQLQEIDKDMIEVVAGKVMGIRQTFGQLQDFSGQIQFYIYKKEFDPDAFHIFKSLLDIGDYVEITGYPMKTMTGELTIRIKSFKIISKALRPLPEK